jgi:DNA-binding NtrC family response regulator
MHKLLVVSDEDDQRNDIVRAAIKAGYEKEVIVPPETWEDALRELSESRSFGVAVIDINLWGKSERGVDYIRQLHVNHPTCIVVALTENRRGDDIGLRAMRAGALEFVNGEWDFFQGEWPAYLAQKLTLYRKLVES